MKVVTWNCNGAFRRKYALLEQFRADLLVIQECEDPSASTAEYRNWAGAHLWAGESKHRGIGVFARGDVGLGPLDWANGNLKLFLPCRLNETVTLIAVWTKSAPEFQYIGQLWKYLALHSDTLRDTPFLVCGDFNSNTCWDESRRSWNHSDVVRELEGLSAVSVYHEHFSEPQGMETRPTLYHQRNLQKPYHVDYAFATPTVWRPPDSSVKVGSHKDWLEFSDHMPMVFAIDG